MALPSEGICVQTDRCSGLGAASNISIPKYVKVLFCFLLQLLSEELSPF